MPGRVEGRPGHNSRLPEPGEQSTALASVPMKEGRKDLSEIQKQAVSYVSQLGGGAQNDL